MESTSKLAPQELANQSFVSFYSNPDNILVSSGPKNGMLWRVEEIDPQETNLVDGLNKVFQTGFIQRDEPSILARLPYIKSHYPHFICASNTHLSDDTLIAWENQQTPLGNYGYFYLIDSSDKHVIKSIPLCEENINQPAFACAYSQKINARPDYAIIEKLHPRLIIGAVPSEFVAFSLEMEKSFILNPLYKGIVYFNKIEKVSGISRFLTFSVFSRKYRDSPKSIVDIFKLYSAKKELTTQPSLLSLFSSRRAANFFPINTRLESAEASTENLAATTGYKKPY
ncbi:MAG: hypothetical protein CFE62_001225 [Candidatus Aquirickettsiella gammari]|jgi:hypothetical protein|uniref:Uncharacterized protein n=1 Tax=Candidatus Aquirickettsiella gammari TaxID=2016198 RepID=A0A370CJH8_9COXI|nr:MAG: hypothetical protein CFE62_001225 [Candidatus Aquirickettsiella gammari]